MNIELNYKMHKDHQGKFNRLKTHKLSEKYNLILRTLLATIEIIRLL